MGNCDELFEAIQARIDATGTITASEIWAMAGQGIGCAIQAISMIGNEIRVTTDEGEIVIEDDPTVETTTSTASSGTIFGLKPVEALLAALLGAAVLGGKR